MSDNIKKIDMKSVGIGGGGIIGLLFLFQNQGINLMNKSHDTSNKLVIERTIANENRILMLENSVAKLSDKLVAGFDGIRFQIRGEVNRLSDIVRETSEDRWTKEEQVNYAKSIEKRIDRLEDSVQELSK